MEFRPMRRHRQQLDETACLDILNRCTYGVLSLTGDNGYPYGVPVNYVYHDGKLYFHTAQRGHKVDALHQDERVCMTVVSKDDVVKDEYTTYFQSVMVFGRTHILSDDDEKLAALTLLCDRFNPGEQTIRAEEMRKGFNHLHMVEIDIDHMSGKEAIELVRMHAQKHP